LGRVLEEHGVRRGETIEQGDKRGGRRAGS